MCQHCDAGLQLLENQAVLGEVHYYAQDDPIELESRKINWDLGVAAGLKMHPELNPYLPSSNDPASNRLKQESAPSNRISKLVRRLCHRR